MEKDNLTQVISLLVHELDIPVTRQSIENEIDKHPNHQSMLAISDILDNWHIPNSAFQLTFDEIIEAKVSVPFIAHFSNGKFVLVNSLDEKKAVVSDESSIKYILRIDDFKKKYNGAILIAEKEPSSGEADYLTKRRKEWLDDIRVPFVIIGATILFTCFLLFCFFSIGLQVNVLILLKTIGLITSLLLLLQSIDTNNPLIQKLCGGDSNKSCNAILSSNSAKVTSWLSWSEVGYFYFAGTWLLLLFENGSLSLLRLLAIGNLMSLPYTFYSINHQWRIAKQWCMFCCVIQGLLWAEFFVFLPALQLSVPMPHLREWFSLAACMATPTLLWIFIKPHLVASKQIQPLKKQLRKFKYNRELFEKMLNEEVKYTLPADEDSLILGNRKAKHIITMISNPFCQPCAKAHHALDAWLATRDDIKLQFVFSTPNKENDPKTKVAAHLMALQADNDSVSLSQALNEWYERKHKNYESWAKNHPVNEHLHFNAHKLLEKQKEWCMITDVKSTPTLFINGRKLSHLYKPEDLKYFI